MLLQQQILALAGVLGIAHGDSFSACSSDVGIRGNAARKDTGWRVEASSCTPGEVHANLPVFERYANDALNVFGVSNFARILKVDESAYVIAFLAELAEHFEALCGPVGQRAWDAHPCGTAIGSKEEQLQFEKLLLTALSGAFKVVKAQGPADHTKLPCLVEELRRSEKSCTSGSLEEGGLYGSTYFHSWLQIAFAAVQGNETEQSVTVLGASLGWQTFWFALCFGVPATGVELDEERAMCGIAAAQKCQLQVERLDPRALPKLAAGASGIIVGDARIARLEKTSLIYLTDLAWPEEAFLGTVATSAFTLPLGAIAVSNRPYFWERCGFVEVRRLSVAVSWDGTQPFYINRLEKQLPPTFSADDMGVPSLLHLYVSVDAPHLVSMAAERGVPSDALDGLQRSAMFVAKSEETAKILIASSVDVGAKDTAGLTALHVALGCGYVGVAHALLAAGADPRAVTTDGQTLCNFALGPSRSEWMKAPLSCSELAVADGSTETLLRVLSERPKGPLAKELLEKSGVLAVRKKSGCSPMPSRIQELAVEELLHAGAATTVRNKKDDHSVLHMSKNPSITRQLVQARADVDASHDTIGTPLMLHSGDLSMTRALLTARADPTAKNARSGGGPLHMVRNPLVAEMLLEARSEVGATNRMGQTPLHLAKVRNVAEMLIAHGASVNAKDRQGQMPLHQVISPGVAHLLVSSGAEVNARDGKGRTPISHHIKLAAGASESIVGIRLEIIDVLLSSRADPYINSTAGESPLSLAAGGGAALFELLAKYGLESPDGQAKPRQEL